jgi:heptaprenyl diphosphate synthase
MTLEEQIKQIKNHIKKKTQHPYLDQYISKPVIDDDKITFLILMFRENGNYTNIPHYVTAIMIMQMALDMHDIVGIETLPQAKNRPRQLTVLAGDYYSSQYYCMLTEKQAFSMIRILSDGIRYLNEEKVDLFRGKWHWDQLIAHMKRIETSLIMELADFLNLSHWLPLITAYFTHKRLLSEKRLLENGEGSIFMEPLFQKHPEKRVEFLQKCDEWLVELREEVEKSLKSGIFDEDRLGMATPVWIGEEFVLSPNKVKLH